MGALGRLTAAMMLVACGIGPHAAAPAEGAERRVALVIVNTRYQDLAEMPVAAANGEAVSGALRQAGFDVTMAKDLPHRDLTKKIEQFQTALATSSFGFVYYSGLMLSMGGSDFMVPTDAKLRYEYDVLFDAVELERILRPVQDASGQAAVVFDPVVPNPLLDRLGASMGDRRASLRPVPTSTPAMSRLLIGYAGQPGAAPPPAGGPGAGPYAAALAEELVRPGAGLRGAFRAAERSVADRTGGVQRPWTMDRLDSDVALLPPPPPAAPVVPPAPEARNVPPPPAEAPRTEQAAVVPVPGRKPAAPPPEAAIEVDPLKETLYATEKVRLYKAPDRKAGVVRTVPAAEALLATGRVKGSNWLRIEEKGVTSYALAAGLQKDPPPREEVVPDQAKPSPEQDLQEAMQREMEQRTAGSSARSPIDLRNMGQSGPGPGSGSSNASSGTKVSSLPPAAPNAGKSDSQDQADIPTASVKPNVQQAIQSGKDVSARARAVADKAKAAAERGRNAQRQAAQVAGAGARTTTANGDSYVAETANSDGTGLVVYRFRDGNVYEGEWQKSQPSGYGVLTFQNGDRYEGSFQNGRPNGAGVYHTGDGHTYAGEVRGGQLTGVGELALANGDRYLGELVSGKQHGHGVMTFAAGGRFVGQFKDGEQDGPGLRSYGGDVAGVAAIGGVWRRGVAVPE